MADIHTTEGREVLRREHRLTNLYIPSEVKANLRCALDGLDIAQKMAAWIRVLEEQFRVGGNEALAEWDKWQAGGKT